MRELLTNLRITVFSLIIGFNNLKAQPSAHDLLICTSTNGVNWTNNTLFQDSSGVPSIIQHTTGVIYAAFQWFPAPSSPTNTAHDKIAIKSSNDGGLTWTAPQLANFIGYPSTYKRPFDPTLVVNDNGNIRMYFSASKNGSLTALDSTVHCYSAVSTDGINFTYEGVRILVKDSINIDPAVIKFGTTWHYTAPRAAPQDGAYHFTSNDGLSWTRTSNITSDANHNWTGNLSIDGGFMKFYGTPNPMNGLVWNKQTSDGNTWTPYVNCTGLYTSSTIQADPSVLKISANNYIMIYVSKLSLLNLKENDFSSTKINIYPNPSSHNLSIECRDQIESIIIADMQGKIITQEENTKSIRVEKLEKGIYTIIIKTVNETFNDKIIVD